LVRIEADQRPHRSDPCPALVLRDGAIPVSPTVPFLLHCRSISSFSGLHCTCVTGIIPRAEERGMSGNTRRYRLDAKGFDRLAVSVATATSSRRGVLHRIAGGGLATVLAALGIAGFRVKDAEAKKSCKKRCKQKAKKKDWSSKKKKNCLKKCKKKETGRGVPGTPISNNTSTTTGTPPPGGTCTLGTTTGCPAGNTCVLNAAGASVCINNSAVCTSNAQCATGFCGNITNGAGLCLPCGTQGTTICGTPPAQVCCGVGLTCSPVLNLCIAA